MDGLVGELAVGPVLLIWFPSGWEGYAKWTETDEAEIAALISQRFARIEKCLDQLTKNRRASFNVILGKGPGGRKYRMHIAFIGQGLDSYDFLQDIGVAPVTGKSMDILATLNRAELSAVKKKEKVTWSLAGRMYDDGDRSSIRLIGVSENKAVGIISDS